MTDRILRFPEVSRLVGLGRTTIFERITRGTFPSAVRLSPGCIGWRESEISHYLKGRASLRAAHAGATHLYRHFDSERRLLYVGVSHSALHRLRGHKRESAWVEKVAYISIERFETRALALAAEKMAIKKERPLHNIVHTDRRRRENCAA